MNIRQWMRELKREGWTIEQGKKNVRVRFKDGTTLFCSQTPSDWRAIHKVTAQMKRVEKAFTAQQPAHA